MKADSALIEWLMHESGISRYAISKATGIGQATLSDLATGKTSIDKMTLGNAIKLTEYAEKALKEVFKMKIKRTLSPKGYNHGCTDHAVFAYTVGEDTAVCVEAVSCHDCWQVGHDENHRYFKKGDMMAVSELLSDPDLDDEEEYKER